MLSLSTPNSLKVRVGSTTSSVNLSGPPSLLQPYDFLTTGDIIYNHYGAAKQMMFHMPHYRKGHFPDQALSPDNMDLRYTIVYYFHTLGRSGIDATALECSFRGTTSVTDI